MSATNAPSNPGTPKPPRTPQPSMLARYGSKILAGGVLIGTAYAYLAYRPQAPAGTPTTNPLRTPGVKNIEGAYRDGGATATHTPAYGGTTQGDKRGDYPRDGGATGNKKGPENEDFGDNQRNNPTTVAGKAYKEMTTGSSKGK